MTFPTFTDLTSLAVALEKKGKNPALRQAINQAWRAQSCMGDLRQAEDCCNILTEILKRPRSDDNGEWLTIERAMLSTAIGLYARATSTSGQKGERGSIQLDESKLSSEQRLDHKAIIDVRNQAIAHVYSTHDVGGNIWHRDIFFAFEAKPGLWKSASASNQTGFHQKTFERLSRMCPIASQIITEKFQKRMAAVSHLVNSKTTQQQLNEHAFDPVKVFGSTESVEALIASSNQQSASFWVNE